MSFFFFPFSLSLLKATTEEKQHGAKVKRKCQRQLIRVDGPLSCGGNRKRAANNLRCYQAPRKNYKRGQNALEKYQNGTRTDASGVKDKDLK